MFSFGLLLCSLLLSWSAVIATTPSSIVSPAQDVHVNGGGGGSSNSNADTEISKNDCHIQDTTTVDSNAKVNDNDNDNDASCADPSTVKQKWNWEPTSHNHPCNIRRISHSDLLRLYGPLGVPNLYPHPLVIYFDDHATIRNPHFANMTTLNNLPLNFSPNFTVTLTGSDSLSSHRRTIPLSQYLSEILTSNSHIGHEGETLPNQLGNETWYLFGETFTKEWNTQLLQHYVSSSLPSCHSCTPLHYQQQLIALSFGIGNIGSGVQWHLHGPGFSETIHGRKHWVLYPPELRPTYQIEYASRHWMENVYPILEDWSEEDVAMEKRGHDTFLQKWNNDKRNKSPLQYRMEKNNEEEEIINSADNSNEEQETEGEQERGPSNKKPWECTIHEGEMIYFPDGWHHATINLEKYTVFVSSFTTEHE